MLQQQSQNQQQHFQLHILLVNIYANFRTFAIQQPQYSYTFFLNFVANTTINDTILCQLMSALHIQFVTADGINMNINANIKMIVMYLR